MRAEQILKVLEPMQQGRRPLPDGRFADRAMVAAARRVVDLAARYAT
ncbi:hypothetical protein [Micromonospora globispora]|nr:hypothetical protein [Micromonospora globispora]